ncbi:MAG TPA: hypothetical protein VJR89_22960, partial [Polyangiales bacterium]|nr:hypothetical protein [Polyangiales bacterium]
ARDIPRWLDDESQAPALRDALHEAGAEAPSAAQIERWVASAQAAVANGGGLGSSGLGGLHRLWVVLGVAAVLGGGAFGASRLLRASQPQPALKAIEPSAGAISGQPSIPPQPPTADVVTEVPAKPAVPQARRRDARKPSPRIAPEHDPTAEVLLLREAKRALAHTPERAEALLREHLAKYPRGVFAEEREAMLIEADWLLGREARARAGVEHFRKRHANSPYLRRLEHVLMLEEPHAP